MIVKRSSIPDVIPDDGKPSDSRRKRAEAGIGEVKGSGAGAGGSGDPEVYASDPQAGDLLAWKPSTRERRRGRS